jgi:hypothetical protein
MSVSNSFKVWFASLVVLLGRDDLTDLEWSFVKSDHAAGLTPAACLRKRAKRAT